MKLESKFQRSEFTLKEENEKMVVKVDELQEDIAKRDQELFDLRERLQEVNFINNSD